MRTRVADFLGDLICAVLALAGAAQMRLPVGCSQRSGGGFL